MKNKTRLIYIILLLIAGSSFGQQNDGLAPEATDTDTEISFWDMPYLEKAFIDTTPADRKDGLAVGELGVDGGNKDMIVKLAEEIADSKYGLYDSMLITHKGKLLFESYYLRGRINLLHQQASATKTYTSLVLGRAIQLGYLTMADLDKPLVNFLKDLDPSKFVTGVEKITLYQALTMRGGLRISSDTWEELKEKPAVLKGQGLVQALLEHSAPITSDSQSFVYGNFNPDLVMQVIDAVVPGTAKDFIKNELFDKIGITNYRWQTHIDGLPAAGGPSYLTSRDMLKLGTLIINKGTWNGEQLISSKFLANATSKITKATATWHPDNFNYGYFFYQTDITIGDKDYDVNIAWGGGGQHLITVEELDLIIVITGHDREDTIFTQVSKNILPAFVKDEFPVLEDRYLGQKPPGLTPVPFAPGLVSTEHYEYSGVFTPDMKEFYFIANGGKYKKSTFVVYYYKNNKWQDSIVSRWLGQPTFSLDGKTMHLGGRYKQRTKTGWSELKKLESPINDNDDLYIMRLSSSANGTYYFDSHNEKDPSFPIRYSRLIDGMYEKPKALPKEINTGIQLNHPFIALDESYILWDTQREDGYGDSDIYISFKKPDGSWGSAINLGDKINTDAWEAAPTITPDGKYLFFNRNVNPDNYENVDIFWVNAQIIETLRPK